MTKLSALSLAAAAAALPFSAGAQTLEPSARSFAEAAAAGKPIYELSYEDARQLLSTIQAKPGSAAATKVEDLVWPIGPTGKVRVRIVKPQAAAASPLPALFYFHGGGWVMGDRNTHDHLVRQLSERAGAAVIFVEYDNAPEVRYPENNEQAYAALVHAVKNAASLGIDGSRVAVAGDSAGGNMAIAVALMAKQRRGPAIAHQLLFYPVTADVSENDSYRQFGNGPFLTRKAMDYFLAANFPANRRKDVLAFPLTASTEQLRGLPSTTVIVAENDLLRDEGEAFARKLIDAGVSVTSTRYNGTIHDFVMLNPLAESAPAKAAIAQAAAELRDVFAR